jgi:hypothetical protein
MRSDLYSRNGYIASMSKQLWIGQRFLINERGHYTVMGDCGTDRVIVEIDPSIFSAQAGVAERGLATIRRRIQTAARQKWAAGAACPVLHAHSGQIRYHAIVLTAKDLLGE